MVKRPEIDALNSVIKRSGKRNMQLTKIFPFENILEHNNFILRGKHLLRVLNFPFTEILAIIF